MKLIHLSDLHLGKRVNGFSMLEDQAFILERILEIIDGEAPEGVLIAGDVYDRSVPPTEAVRMFDDFLTALAGRRIPTFVISGNHDSPERIAFGGRLMDLSGVHLSPVYEGRVTPLPLRDAFGTVWVYMLPFVRPANVRAAFPEEAIADYTEALRCAISHMAVDPGERNVLVTHQFVTGAARCDSEDISVGGTDNVDAGVFAPFDYVALGHIHGPQNVGDRRIRYCGTPLKYSFSERDHVKSVTVVELGEKGDLKVRTVPLTPLHDLRQIRGTYEELTLRTNYEGTVTEDYLRVILTDEQDVPDAMARLRTVYPNLMRLEYDNARTRAGETILPEEEMVRRKTALELFSDFFEMRNNRPMSREQSEFAGALFERVKEGEP